MLHHVGRPHEVVQHRHAFGVLEVDEDAPLPAVAAHGDARLHPEAVEERVVHLDDGGAEVGEQLRAERTRHREPEVEHHDALERRVERAAVAGRGGIRRRGRGRLGAHRLGVRAGLRDTADRRRRGLLELVGAADHADAVDLHHAAVLDQQRVEQRLLG